MCNLYAWGANSHGQLGLGYESEQCILPELVPFTTKPGASIKSITGGGGHCMILDDNNTLYACGWNTKGQLGNSTTKNSSKFIELSGHNFENKTIVSVACGWDVTGAVCSDGQLYLWGNNKFNQLGFDEKECLESVIPKRLHLPNNEKVKTVQFNLRSTSILTVNGILYLFGKNRQFESLKNDERFKCVRHNDIEYWMLDAIVNRISAGKGHTLWMIDSRNVDGIGENRYCQLKSGEFDEEIVDLKCGWTHNVALTKNGKLLSWGRNNYGQLGLGELTVESIGIRGKIGTPMNVENVKDFHLGAEHGLLISESGILMTWGWNEHGNCGNGTIENINLPVEISPSMKCTLAGCGAGFCYAILEDR